MGNRQADQDPKKTASHIAGLNYRKQLAIRLWQAAIKECQGETATKHALSDLPRGRHYAILSMGKAASSMTLGAHGALGDTIPSLSITKDGHTDQWLRQLSDTHPNIKLLESAHPVPDARSLVAGGFARDFIERLGEKTCLIMLVSGGTSALCELLPVGMSLDDLKKMTEEKLANGATIAEINKARSEISLIKKGKILKNFKGEEVKTFVFSDVAGNKIETIASGIGIYPSTLPKDKFKHSSTILKSNEDARAAVQKQAIKGHLQVIDNSERLYGDVFDCAHILSKTMIEGPEGVYIYGGEPTVELPENPGEGGRSQCLALALAKEIREIENLTCLIAGTDGTDGPTDSAGGLVDFETFSPAEEAEEALRLANSGAFLRKKNSLYISGPTGTNVSDIAVCLKLSEDAARAALEHINQ